MDNETAKNERSSGGVILEEKKEYVCPTIYVVDIVKDDVIAMSSDPGRDDWFWDDDI